MTSPARPASAAAAAAARRRCAYTSVLNRPASMEVRLIGPDTVLAGCRTLLSVTVAAPVLLLDGASMWFRSFFGVPSSITAPDGRPVNALRGFLDCRRHGDHARTARPAGGVPRRRLAAAVAGGPHPVVQGAPRRRGGTGRATRHRRGARRPDPAGRHDHGDPRRVRHPDRGRAGLRGRRRARHAGQPASARTPSSS